jgi:hypothetical protein
LYNTCSPLDLLTKSCRVVSDPAHSRPHVARHAKRFFSVSHRGYMIASLACPIGKARRLCWYTHINSENRHSRIIVHRRVAPGRWRFNCFGPLPIRISPALEWEISHQACPTPNKKLSSLSSYPLVVLHALLPSVGVAARAQDVDYCHDRRRSEEDPV